MFVVQWLSSAFFLAAWTLCLWPHVRLGRISVDLLSLVLMHLLLKSALVMLTGLAGLFSASTLFWISVPGLAILFLFFRKDLGEAKNLLVKDLLQLWIQAKRSPGLSAVQMTVVGILGLRMLAHIWILPPYIWDVHSYHLPRIAEWIQSGSLLLPHLPVARVYWPAGFELIQAWWAVFPHHDVLVEMAGLPFYLIAVVSTYGIARSAGVRRKTALFCANIFAFTPGLLLNAVSSKNDIAIASLYLFLVCIWSQPVPKDLAPRRLMLSWTALSVAVGIKPTIIFILPGLLLLLPLGLRKTDITCLKKIRFRMVYIVPVLLGLMLASYWYLHNQLRFGNPFYPTSFRVANQVVTGRGGAGGGQQGGFQFDSLRKDLDLLLTRKIFDQGEPYNPDLAHMTGWGWFAFGIGWLSLVWSFCRSSACRWLSGAFLVSFFTLLGWVDPDPWNMRFAQWMPALPAIGFGILLQDMKLPVLYKRALILLAVGLTFLNAAAGLGNGYMTLEHWRAYAKTPVRNRSAMPDMLRRVNERVPAGEPLAVRFDANDRFYWLYGPDLSRRLIYPDDRSDGYAAAMRRYGVNYLYFPDHIGPEREWKRLRSDLEQGLLIPLGRGVYKRAEEEGQ